MLDLNAINRVAPYRVEWRDGDENAILFHIKSGDYYVVSFVRDNGLLNGLSAYQLSFYPHSQKVSYDKDISATIWHIIDNFLTLNTTAIIYITDDTDKRGAARSRLFESWYHASDPSLSQKYILKTIQQRAGVLINKNNPLLSKYLSMIESIDAILQKNDIE